MILLLSPYSEIYIPKLALSFILNFANIIPTKYLFIEDMHIYTERLKAIVTIQYKYIIYTLQEIINYLDIEKVFDMGSAHY